MLAKYFEQWILWCAMNGTINEILSYLLVFVSVVLVVMVFIEWLKYIRSLPPGPWGLPIIGYLPYMKGSLTHLRYSELAKKYGSIFSVRLGNQLVVVLSNYRVIRDAFRREEFTGRPHTEFTNILDGYGVINTDGAMWKDQRKFLQDKLRRLGMTFSGASRTLLESRIRDEVEMFLRRCAMRRGAPTNISTSLSMSISNVICSLIMGVRFHHGKRFKRFMDLIQEGFKLFASVASINYIPIMRYLPWMQGPRNKISQNREEMANFFQETIDQHKETFNKNNPRDLLDAYLIEIQQAEEEGRGNQLFQGKNHDRQMQQILGDFFSAGMETVKTTLEWAVVLMLHNPEAARAVQKELDQVIGRSRMPTMDDLSSLPITEATIYEILRRSSVVPLGTTHATTRTVTFEGYVIPAGSQVVPLLYAVNMDPELWDEPEVFRPARFLTCEGKVHKPEYFMPFGVGKRMCMGPQLARSELFAYLSSLLHKFHLRLPEGASLPSLRGNEGVTISPDPFKICMLERDFNPVDGISDEVEVIAAGGPLRNVGSH